MLSQAPFSRSRAGQGYGNADYATVTNHRPYATGTGEQPSFEAMTMFNNREQIKRSEGKQKAN